MALYARTNWSFYRPRPFIQTYAQAGNASGSGATATATAPSGSATGVTVTLTGFRLISKSGAPLASQSGITAIIRKTVPSTATAPDKVVTGVSTDGSGNLSDIDISDIQSNADPVFVTLLKDGSPAKGSAIKLTPTVS